MTEPLYSVARAAELIAAEHEPVQPVANQLRRLAQKGLVHTKGQSGTGRTAANMFSIEDIAVARLHRALIALGIASDDVLREVAFACYEVPPGVTEALEDCKGYLDSHPNWIFALHMTDPNENGVRTISGKIFEADYDTPRAIHPALAVNLEIPMGAWLVKLARVAEES